jgi:hypothetical protein
VDVTHGLERAGTGLNTPITGQIDGIATKLGNHESTKERKRERRHEAG